MGQFVLLTASENKASKKVSGLLGLGAESAFLITRLGRMSTMSTIPNNSRERAGGPAGSGRVRGEAGAGSQPVGNAELLGWLSFLPSSSWTLLSKAHY